MKNKIIFGVKTVRTVDFLFKRFVSAYLHKQSHAHNTDRGHRMAVFANDFIGIEVNSFGYYEREDLLVLFQFLSPILDELKNSTALDVGANIGNHSIYFSRYFAKIYALEPNPSTFNLLRSNSEWQRKILPLNYGLGEQSGSFQMREELGNFGASAIVNETREKATGNISVSVRTLDEHIDEFKNVAFMKMDVEGFELKVLKGAKAFILANQPVIVLEQHADDFRSGTTPAIELLQQMDYTICWHQSGLKSKRKLIRLASNLFELWSGRHHKIVTGEQVPEDFHSMLIAIPPRFHSRLVM